MLIFVLTFSSLEGKEVFKEDFEDGDVSNWQIWNYQNGLKMQVAEEGAGGSKRAYKIGGSQTGDTAFKLTSSLFPVKGGQTYTLQMDSKHNCNLSQFSGGGPAKDPTRIIWYDANGVEISYTKIPGFDTPNPNWHQDSFSPIVAPAKAVKASIQLGQDTPNITPVQYWLIDNVVLREGEITAKVERTRDITTIKKPLFSELLSDKPGNYLVGRASTTIASWEIPEEVKLARSNWREENIQELINNRLLYYSASPYKGFDRSLLKKGMKAGFWLNFTATMKLKDLNLPQGASYFHPSCLSKFEAKVDKWLQSIAQDKGDWWVTFDDESCGRFFYPFENTMPEGIVFPKDLKEEWTKEIKDKYGYGKYGPPSGFEGSPFQWIAYRRWAWDKYASLQGKIYQKVKKVRPDVVFFANNFFSIYFVPVWDYGLMGNCDMMMVDPYPTQLETKRANCGHFMPGFMTKLVKDISGKPIVCISQGFVYHGVPVKPEWIQEWISQVIRVGGDGIDWYAHRFPYVRGGSTKYADPELWDVMMQVSKKVAEMKRIKLPKEIDTGILYSTDSYAAKIIRGKTWGAEQFEGQEIYSCYAILGQKGKSWFKFLDDNLLERKKAKLSDYKILYLPYVTYERKPVVEEIENFVKAGGSLVCGDPLALSFSSDGEDLSPVRERLFGVKIVDPNQQDELKIVDNQIFPEIRKGLKLPLFPDQRFSFTSQKVEVTGKQTTILAKFSNGDPAIVLNQYGKGKIVYFATNPFTPEAIEVKDWIELFRSLQKSLGASTEHKVWDFLIPVEFRKVEKWWLKREISKGPDETGNYVKNGDFELDQNQDNFPDYWECILSKGAPREIYTREEGHKGKALAIDNRTVKKWAEVRTPVSGIKPNTNYKVSLWVKQTSSASLQLLTRGKDFKFYYLKGVQPDKWTKLEKIVNSGPNEGIWTISFLIENLPMKVWIDEVRIEEVGNP